MKQLTCTGVRFFFFLSFGFVLFGLLVCLAAVDRALRVVFFTILVGPFAWFMDTTVLPFPVVIPLSIVRTKPTHTTGGGEIAIVFRIQLLISHFLLVYFVHVPFVALPVLVR